jgi:hypothetical protein
MKRSMMVNTLLGLICLVGLVGCSSKVNKENLDKLQPGMTVEQVEKILGEGEVVTGGAIDVPGFSNSATIMQWGDETKSITVTFTNGKATGIVANGIPSQ